MSKKIDFSSAIASLQSLNSNTNSIKQTISEVQKIVDDTSNNLSKLENHNGSLAENHHETYYSKLIGTVNHKDIFDEWAIWKINGCNNIQSTINNLINKISNLDNSINQLKLKSINADAAIAIMEKYNVGIEAILASGITLPQDLLDKSFASSQLATNMATDEYKADNREWQGISDENIKWWTDKVLKFEKDPNHIGSNAWLVWQQDENGEWIGMGFTDEKTALEYAKIFNSELINYQEEIQQSIPKDINANLLNTLYSFGLVSIIPSNQDFNDLKENLKYLKKQNIQSQLSNVLDTRNPTANKYLTKQIGLHGTVTGISELITDKDNCKYQQISFEDGTQINVWKDKRPDGKIIGIHQYNNEGKETIYTKITEDNNGNIKGEIKNYDQNQETSSNDTEEKGSTPTEKGIQVGDIKVDAVSGASGLKILSSDGSKVYENTEVGSDGKIYRTYTGENGLTYKDTFDKNNNLTRSEVVERLYLRADEKTNSEYLPEGVTKAESYQTKDGQYRNVYYDENGNQIGGSTYTDTPLGIKRSSAEQLEIEKTKFDATSELSGMKPINTQKTSSETETTDFPDNYKKETELDYQRKLEEDKAKEEELQNIIKEYNEKNPNGSGEELSALNGTFRPLEFTIPEGTTMISETGTNSNLGGYTLKYNVKTDRYDVYTKNGAQTPISYSEFDVKRSIDLKEVGKVATIDHQMEVEEDKAKKEGLQNIIKEYNEKNPNGSGEEISALNGTFRPLDFTIPEGTTEISQNEGMNDENPALEETLKVRDPLTKEESITEAIVNMGFAETEATTHPGAGGKRIRDTK